jgi:hypothetical protein
VRIRGDLETADDPRSAILHELKCRMVAAIHYVVSHAQLGIGIDGCPSSIRRPIRSVPV